MRYYTAVRFEPTITENGEEGTVIGLANIGSKADAVNDAADAEHLDDDTFERILGQAAGKQGAAYIVVTSAPVYEELVALLTDRKPLMSHPKAIGLLVLIASDDDIPLGAMQSIGEA